MLADDPIERVGRVFDALRRWRRQASLSDDGERWAALQPFVVITGGSEGIGLALACEFYRRGASVLLVARDAEKLRRASETLSGGAQVLTLSQDVTATGAAMAIEARVAHEGGYIDILVNSAGVGIGGAFAEQDGDCLANLVDLNIKSVTALTRHVLPGMLARGRGGVLNVASLGAYAPGPWQAAYYASKAYVVSLSEAIATETSGQGVRVGALLPGPVATAFHQRMGSDTALYLRLLPVQSAETIARAAYWRFRLGQRVIIPGILKSADGAGHADRSPSHPRPAHRLPLETALIGGHSQSWNTRLQFLQTLLAYCNLASGLQVVRFRRRYAAGCLALSFGRRVLRPPHRVLGLARCHGRSALVCLSSDHVIGSDGEQRTMTSKAARLSQLLAVEGCRLVPSCYDALSAKMIASAAVPFTFMTGFGVSAARLGEPDLGLISYGEIVDSVRDICAAAPIPVIADGDTGYGNALNVERTVRGYAQAGAAAVMIEDQVAPKRCGHTKGKLVVDRPEALDRIRAAAYARDGVRRAGGDILILARTDARATHGLDEAIWRANAFRDAGADILFIEAPQSQAEMRRATREAPGIHMANMVEGGATPIPSQAQLGDLGYRFAIFPLTLMAAAMQAMQACLADFAAGRNPSQGLMDFAELRRVIGFDDYYDAEQRYSAKR